MIRGFGMKFVRQLVAFSVFLFLAAFAIAQDTGQITGTVHDSSGASIPNAQVKVSSPERGIVRDTVSNSTGEYSVSGLPPGTYNVRVTVQGFKTYEAKGVILRVAQKTRADAELEVGGSSTEVTVAGESIGQVETQSSEMSGVITG